MNETYYILESISLDLKRIALGIYHQSPETVLRFCAEIPKREKELTNEDLEPYLSSLIEKTNDVLKAIDSDRAAEDALMYSTLLHNYAQSRLMTTSS